MGTRIDLYALPGLPLRVEDLMPQSLLARCGGSLSAQGHDVSIYDGGTVTELSACGADAVSGALAQDRNTTGPPPGHWAVPFRGKTRRRERLLEGLRGRRVARALAAQAQGRSRHLAVIQISHRKDVAEARALAGALKAAVPVLQILVVGDIARHYARPLLAGAREFDMACVGPAESVLTALARSLDDPASWSRIPGLIFRRGGQLATGRARALPVHPNFSLPDYHPARYPAMLDSGKIKFFTVTQSSGLSHAAHYRGESESGSVQVRETRHLRAEVEQIHTLYGTRAFHIRGEHTPANAIQQFAAECHLLPFDIRYSRDAHVLEIGLDSVPMLALSGCRAVSFGTLTGSQSLLSDFYGENWTISQAEAIFRECKAHNLFLHAAYIFPCPADDYHTRAETFRLVRRSRPDSVGFRLPELTPGSAWYQHAQDFAYGVTLKRLEHWITAPGFSPGLAEEGAALPFQIGGQRGKTVARAIETALSELAELGQPHTSGVAAGMMARVTGHEGMEGAYISTLDQALGQLDLPRLHDIIEVFNTRATAPINTIDLYRPVSIRKAVGN